MIVIRRGVFETNSSSTHSITLCSKDEYDKWEKGELILNESYSAEEQFITRAEAIELLKKSKYYSDINFEDEDELSEALRNNDLYTSDGYFGHTDLETFEETFTTKSGETVVAFGKYGYDG